MSVTELLSELHAKKIALAVKGEELIVQGKKRKLEPALLNLLRENKQALIQLIKAGEYSQPAETGADVPPNLIPASCDKITPGMLPLILLAQEDIDRIASSVPGGKANVQDIYPLAPLQEGILFHYLQATKGDMYLTPAAYHFNSRAELDKYLQALQAVIDRHDILRTAILWEGLPQPVQVVLRRASLLVEEIDADSDNSDAVERLRSRFDPKHYRIDIQTAPLMRVFLAQDKKSGTWTALWLSHHLAGDPTTQEMLAQEVQAHLDGNASSLPPPLPFRNFIAQTQSGTGQTEHESFFRKMLADVDEPTSPFGLLDVHGNGAGLTEDWYRLTPQLTMKLREQARLVGVSTATLVHLAWALVLSRVSARDSVVFGTVLFGRVQAGADRVLGLFMNTLPVRVTLAARSVVDSVRDLHAFMTELLRHEHASLVLAQRCSSVRPPAPLFSTLLNFRHIPHAAPPAYDGKPDETSQHAFELRTNYPLTLNVNDYGNAIVLNPQVQSPIDPRQLSTYMMTALQKLVETLEHSPAVPLRSMDVMPEDERHRILVEWNATAAAYPRDKCIHQFVEEHARRAPDWTAIVHKDREISYGELNAEANRLARYLREAGVRTGAAIAILLPRSIECITAQLAVVKCGGVFVTLDLGAPIERQAFIIDDCGAKFVITLTAHMLTGLSDATHINLDEIDTRAQPSEDLSLPGKSENAAHITYTSGSTGTPKGVVVPHRAIARVAVNNGYAEFTAADRFAYSSNPAWDANTLEVWVPLLNGASIAVVDQTDVLAPEKFRQSLLSRQVNVLWISVGLFNQYADSLADVWPRLRYLMVGGDALDPRIIARILRNCPPHHLINGYGPTETTVFAITNEITAVADSASSVPIGRPISNTRIYILDPFLRPVPIGVTGEIYIGGDGVALGYQNRPELNAERFVPDIFASNAKAVMYRSGDLGRYNADGVIEFMGRNDFQVKLRGFRIEPGEIESRLLTHPAIEQAMVIVREDTPGDKRLAAYLTLKKNADGTTHSPALDSDSLRRYLSEYLPEYMLPHFYAVLDALPLTPNGKVDRKALPLPAAKAASASCGDTPSDEIETALAQIWCDVLKVEAVGRDDDFFDLGGHSLLAVRTASRIREALGVEISVTDLFLRPTLTALAEVIRKATRSELPAIRRADREQPLPLSFAQQRLWFLAQMEGASEAYHIPVALRMDGQLNQSALRRALDYIMARHEALRTTFVMHDGVPVQRIAAADIGFTLREINLCGQQDMQVSLDRYLHDESTAPFDLAQGPLIRGCLIRLADDCHALLVTMHHIVSDGWSMGVLTKEFSALYQAFDAGKDDPLPPLPIQYADYAAWQRRWVEGKVLQKQAEYWQGVLAGAPALLELPIDRPRPAQQDYAGGFAGLALDSALTEALKSLSRKHDTTLFMTVLAGWALLLSRLANQDDVVIGTPSANRGRSELDPLIGFFVNTLAIRVDLSGNPTVKELLEQVKTRALEAQEHQDLPFEHVVELVKPSRSTAHSPIFQVMFGWHNNEEVPLELPGLDLSPVGASVEMAKFDMTLNLSEDGEGISGGLVYATALFDEATVHRYLGYLRNILAAMTADDAVPVRAIHLMDESERQCLLVDWNDTCVPYPQDKCLHQLFEARAAAEPDRVAVVGEGGSLTYGELNARANQLAHHLRELGVGTDVLVGICMERSPNMLASLLAIVKAGGAYVPIDPMYPKDRIRHMMEDSRPVVTITQHNLRAALPSEAGTCFQVDGDWERIRHLPVTNPDFPCTPQQLAYVIYTSGSTGKPKGVAVEHRPLVNFLSSMAEVPGICSEDAMLALTSLSFDIAGLELYLPLIKGARVICAPVEAATDPAYLSKVVSRFDVSMMQATPTTWRMFLQQDWLGFRNKLKVLCGGEALPGDLASALLARASEVWNVYGPTETTIWSAIHRVTTTEPTSCIGRPIGNTKTYILDRHGEPVPAGVAGELYIGGEGLARGYLNRPDLTAERFLPDPFSGASGGRMYKTGDLARYLENGNIDFLGRLDHQVKVRGFRIELGEIESALALHPQVKQCVVAAHDDAAGDRRIAAYVVSRKTHDSATSIKDVSEIGFSLFYFGAEEQQDENYRLYLECAKFADQNDFEAVWTPERHFHQVGRLYPNPAVLNAALATVTKRIRLRSGSVVLPLHDPIRVAEEWSVVDNLSGGRVGVSIASDGLPRDFVLAPEHYETRKEVMIRGIHSLQALWRGESLSFEDGAGKQSRISIYPKPLQSELPLWLASSGNPETFIQAGSIGTNVLTHLLGQTIDEVAASISLYREARAKNGYDPDEGKVTLMIHTFVGADFDDTLARAREPFLRYLRSHLGLLEAFAKSLNIPPEALHDQKADAILSFVFERYSKTASLIGTPQTCRQVVTRLHDAGVDELACLIDWIAPELALENLAHLKTLQELAHKGTPTARSLRHHLKKHLPDYMLPNSFTFLDDLPRTPNGKLDRKALLAPEAAPRSAAAYAAPLGETEILIAKLWAEVLNTSRVGRHDDFFELGGHSLLAVHIVERMRAAGLEADVRMLFSSPTVAELALAAGKVKEITL